MELIDYNPRFGRWTFAGDDPHTGDTIIRELFDKNHALAVRDRAQLLAADKLARGEDMRLAFSLPPYVQVEMMDKWGVDCRNRDHWDRVFDLVRTEYPHLLVNT